MTLYLYDQNNSGGFFTPPAIMVVVDADSPEEADSIALENEIYFDTDYGVDCSCCGVRWSPQSGGYPDVLDSVDELDRKSAFASRWAAEAKIATVLFISKDE